VALAMVKQSTAGLETDLTVAFATPLQQQTFLVKQWWLNQRCQHSKQYKVNALGQCTTHNSMAP